MNRKELIEMIERGTSSLRNFIAEMDDQDDQPSTYEDWSDGEVVGHIVGWMNYSIDKLSCIKLGTKQRDEYSQITGLDEINQILFRKSQSKKMDELESEYLNALGKYIGVVALYSNDEINLDTFDTGFKMDLWRYMIMDTVIHPMQHILYQDIKKKRVGRLVAGVLSSEAIFEKYSPGKKAFNLSEFDTGPMDFQKTLQELEKEYSQHDGVVELVKMNLTKLA